MRFKTILCSVIAIAGISAASSQVPPTGVPDQEALLRSSDPHLAANKKLVFDMWRAIIQGGRTDMVAQYFTEGYIQHNPNVATGRAAMVDYMEKTRPICEIQRKINFPVIAIMAEGDLVTVASVSNSDDPTAPGKKYAGTHFDMFRIENGKIAEHWDSVAKDANAFKYNPNTQNKPQPGCKPRH